MGVPGRRDAKYMEFALAGARIFSTCGKGKYAAIVTDVADQVLSVGYNGGPRGVPHCDTDGGCPRLAAGSEHLSDPGNCISVHAEINALIYADPVKMRGGTITVTGPPCFECAKAIINAGIRRVVYYDADELTSSKVEGLLGACGVEVVGCVP